jgi:hypothetical protein
MRINPFKHADHARLPSAATGKAGGRPRRSMPVAVLITGIALTSAVAVIGGGGLASASVSPAAVQTEHFQLVTASATSNTAGVIAYGAFTGSAVDIMGNTTDTFKFPNGSFQVRHSPGKGPQSFNPNTCLLTVNQHGTYTLGHGTGRYAGISGHGTYQISILGIGARSKGRCSQNQPPVAFQQIIKASGPVHL